MYAGWLAIAIAGAQEPASDVAAAVEGRLLVPEEKLPFQLVTGPERTLAMLALGEVTCRMRIGVTAQGVVDAVSVAEGCPEPLRAFLVAAVPAWQFAPWLVDGAAVPIAADVDYTMNPGGAAQFHQSEVPAKRRVMPTIPKEARKVYPNGAAVDCRVRVFIDTTGVPYEVRPEPDCPEVFHQATQEALMAWRWHPAKIEDQAVKAQFVMTVKYRLD